MGTFALASGEFSYRLTTYRYVWRASVVSSFVAPLLMLTSMGVGMGKLVNQHATMPGGVNYVTYIAGGVLAGTVMQVSIFEASYPVSASVKWVRTYYAACATPLRPFDVYLGHLAYIVFRAALSAVFFLAVMAAFGTVHSWWGILALPAAALTGLAFASVLMAFAVWMHELWHNVVFRLIMMPLFLFSGTFFPVSRLPGWLRPVAYATPLWHGVELCRRLCLGSATLGGSLVHVAYLAAMSAAGIAYARRTFQRKLHG